MKLYQNLFVFIGIAVIWCGGYLLTPINRMRQENQLVQNEVMTNAPPQLVVTTMALGALRGLVIDYLWLRAAALREQGEHYEIVQLYDWIGKLQPRITQVWIHSAWEMAYNIAASVPNPQERWRWIYKSIEHLRDYGIYYNQNSPELYRQLGWIFFDKMGLHSADQYSPYYQNFLIQMLDPIFGKSQNVEELVLWNKKKLLENLDAKKIIEKLQLEDFNIFERELEEIRNKLKLFKQQKGYTLIDNYLRSQHLQKVFKMNPEKMLAIEKKYKSKLDWRLAATHALYWVEQGIEKRIKYHPELKNRVLDKNLDRLKYNSLKQLFEYGQVVARVEHGLVCVPNFKLLKPLHQTYEQTQKKWGVVKGMEPHKDFLEKVVRQCYLFNKTKTCKKYYKILQQKFPRNKRFKKSLSKYLRDSIREQANMAERHMLHNMIISTLVNYYQARLNKQNNFSVGLYNYVQVLYKVYIERHGRFANVPKMQKPKPFAFFVNNAIAYIKNQVIKKYKSKVYWEKLVRQNPFLKRK